VRREKIQHPNGPLVQYYSAVDTAVSLKRTSVPTVAGIRRKDSVDLVVNPMKSSEDV
jgi:hypothetical protein